MKSTDIRVRRAAGVLEQIDYRCPIKFGGRVVTDVTLLHVHLEVETRDGRRGIGLGSMPLGNVWAWPSGKVAPDASLAAMIELGLAISELVGRGAEAGHPLEICAALASHYAALAADVQQRRVLPEPIPKLAQLVCASPVEAALFDAYGKALGRNAYQLLGPEFVARDLSSYLGPEFAGEYLDRYTLAIPKPRMPLYHLVGALDPLTLADVKQPVGDGLPETLQEWIAYNGLTHLKIKLAGDDLAWDVARVVAVENAACLAQRERGCTAWNYSLDFNEKCASEDYVLQFLAQVEAQSPAALARVQYIEQPTHRDLQAHPEQTMHRAAKIKPIVIDESLVDYESLLLARERGYSGVALKACKGHSEALLMGAAAQKFGLFLCVQDLTCTGASLLHSASLAARIPTVAAIEANGRQYCPAGNRGWDKRYPAMFHITDGTVGTLELDGPGLGY